MTSVDTSTSDGSAKLTREEVWDRRDKEVQRGFELSKVGLVDAFPGTGKSYGVPKWAAKTGKPVTVLAPRHDLLDEYESWCNENDLHVGRIPSFYRNCTGFEKNEKGEYDPIDGRARELKEKYEQGFAGYGLHEENDDLTCQVEGQCPFMTELISPNH